MSKNVPPSPSCSHDDLTYVVQHEGGSIAVLPEDDPPHTPASSVGAVVLSSNKAVLHHLVARGAHPVTVSSPGEDLHPADDVVRGVRLVGGAQAHRVVGRVCYCDPLHCRVVAILSSQKHWKY